MSCVTLIQKVCHTKIVAHPILKAGHPREVLLFLSSCMPERTFLLLLFVLVIQFDSNPLPLFSDVIPSIQVLLSIAEEKEAQVLVVGTRGNGALKRILVGSVADYIMHHAHCTVMVVRPDELFDEPIVRGIFFFFFSSADLQISGLRMLSLLRE